nr:DNA-3-methyladenine glycosylase [Urinicoccus massiliensis]
MKKLSLDYYQANALDLAPDLIGKILCHREKDQVLMGRIIESEAYLQDDKACHAYGGKKTQRTAPCSCWAATSTPTLPTASTPSLTSSPDLRGMPRPF